MDKVVLDFNVFVAAAFNRRSSSARLVALARAGRLTILVLTPGAALRLLADG